MYKINFVESIKKKNGGRGGGLVCKAPQIRRNKKDERKKNFDYLWDLNPQSSVPLPNACPVSRPHYGTSNGLQ